MRVYRNAHHAIRAANAGGPMCVGYDTEQVGWVLYHPEAGAPRNVEPEFLCFASGRIPWPLSESAEQIIEQLLDRLLFKAII